jgi:hypothetical protein
MISFQENKEQLVRLHNNVSRKFLFHYASECFLIYCALVLQLDFYLILLVRNISPSTFLIMTNLRLNLLSVTLEI